MAKCKGNMDFKPIMPSDHSRTNFRHLRYGIQTLIADNLNIIDIEDELVKAKLVSSNQLDAIRQIPGHVEQVKQLLEVINEQCRPGLVEEFLRCLKIQRYNHTVRIIKDFLDKQFSKAINDLAYAINLRTALVPQKPEIFIERGFEYRLKDELLKACGPNQTQETRLLSPTKWVLVHGMAGIGKTSITVAAIRSPEIWSTCFRTGIFWLDIGKPGTEKLIIKLGQLLQLAERKTGEVAPVASQTIETIIVRLATIFTEERPDSAVILDDVWDPAIVREFQRLPCKCIIVTSRRADLFQDHFFGYVAKVDIASGFTEGESREYLSKVVEKPEDKLPPEANQIHEQCTGSPMLLSLIGPRLKKYPTRWAYYLDQLMNHTFDHENIDKAIAASVDDLNEDMKSKFFDFAVFDDDVPIPASVFQTLWNISDVEEVENVMDNFVNQSLVTKSSFQVPVAENGADYTESRVSYRFHDLILNYSRTHLPCREHQTVQEALVDKHRTLFNKYGLRCGQKYENLADDSYFHAFVGYHLSQGKMFSDIVRLYGNDQFLERRLEFCGPEVVLVDAILFKKQHPFLLDIMESIENKIQERFEGIAMPSPNVNEKRRRSVYASASDLRLNRRSYVDTSSPSPSPNRDGGRVRSSSESDQGIHEVHSEPAISDPESGRSPRVHQSHTVPEIAGSAAVPSSSLLTPVSMNSLRNDFFEDY